MNHAVRPRGALLALILLACALVLPAGALASKASIHRVIEKASPNILKVVVKGLEAIIVGYGHLKAGFADQASDQQAAEAEVASALSAVKTGKKELKAGVARSAETSWENSEGERRGRLQQLAHAGQKAGGFGAVEDAVVAD